MTGVETQGEGKWDAARTRWRAAANRLWAAALTDAEGYRRLAEGVGDRLAELRRTTATPAELLAVEERSEATLVDGAAYAMRADEIEAEQARARRAALVAAARDEGRTWVVLEEGFTRSVSMHLPTGLALVAIDEPYRDADPHGIGEVALAAETGEVLAGGDDDPTWFATREERDAALAQRRAEIVSLTAAGAWFPMSDERFL
jgi:hypothetical protein